MARTQVTASMQEKAERLADMAHTFARGRSKVSGEGFLVVPGTEPGVAHYASTFGCSCEGSRQRGICTHQLCCQILQRRRDAETEAKVQAARWARTHALAVALGISEE